MSIEEYNSDEFEINNNFEIELNQNEKLIDEDDRCCEAPNIINYKGIYVCNNCGIVRGPMYSFLGSRTFSSEDINKKRINEPFYNDTGYRTLISDTKFDSYGVLINGQTRMKYQKLAKIQKSITSSYERNILVANPRFGQIASALRLTNNVLTEANILYRKALSKHLATGRSIDQLVAACIYISLRLFDLPRTLEEVTQAAQIPEKKISRNYRLLLSELNITLPPQTIPPFISRFGDELNIPVNYQLEAINLFNKAKENGMVINGDPKSYAAAALYIVLKKNRCIKINQSQIASISFISDVTLRKKMNELKVAAS